MVDWNENIVKYKNKAKINTDFRYDIDYQSRSHRKNEWTTCEWMGIVTIVIDNTVVEESYVESGNEGVGKISSEITKLYCTKIINFDSIPT